MQRSAMRRAPGHQKTNWKPPGCLGLPWPFKLAVMQGDFAACFSMASHFLYGEHGVRKDINEAARWLRQTMLLQIQRTMSPGLKRTLYPT